KNTRLVPLNGLLLTNRLIWLGVAAVIFALAYARFRFAYSVGDASASGTPDASGAAALAVEESGVASAISPDVAPAAAEGEPLTAPLRITALPATTQRFDAAARWVQFRAIFARSFGRMVRSRYFGVIVGAGLLYLVVAARAAGKLFGTTTWPVTYQMENLLSGSFGLFMLVIIAFYSGELVWAERDAGLGQLYDATPVTNGITLVAKLSAMIATIAARGYYRFEIGLYLQSLVGFRLVDYALIAVMAMVIHVLVNHKYLGHLIVILAFIGMALLPALGLEHGLYRYGSDSGYIYSDMNGWGPYAVPFLR